MRFGDLTLAEGGNVGTQHTLHSGVGVGVVSGLAWLVGWHGQWVPVSQEELKRLEMAGTKAPPSAATILDLEANRVSP